MYRGDFVTQLTPEAAEQHTRRTMSIPDHVGLGWTPYTYLVTDSAVSTWACHAEAEFNRRCREHGVRVLEWTPWSNGIRSARLVPCSA